MPNKASLPVFDEVCRMQAELRKKLVEWSEENKVPDMEEENDFRELFDKATLGYCSKTPFNRVHPAISDMSISAVLTNVLLNSDEPIIKLKKREEPDYSAKSIKIGVIWRQLLDRLNESVFETAKMKAVNKSNINQQGYNF